MKWFAWTNTSGNNAANAPDMTQSVINRLGIAMRDYNYMILNGSFRQFQVAFGKYEVLKELLIDNGHTVEMTTKVTYTETNSPRSIFTSLSVNGRKYMIPQ